MNLVNARVVPSPSSLGFIDKQIPTLDNRSVAATATYSREGSPALLSTNYTHDHALHDHGEEHDRGGWPS